MACHARHRIHDPGLSSRPRRLDSALDEPRRDRSRNPEGEMSTTSGRARTFPRKVGLAEERAFPRGPKDREGPCEATSMRSPRTPRAAVWPLAMILLTGAGCNNIGRDTTPRNATSVQTIRSPVAVATDTGRCPPLPPVARRPKGMIDIDVPQGSKFVEPAAWPGKGVRADLFVPLSVKQAHRFFVKQTRGPAREVVFSEYEGFEAEVFFHQADGQIGLIRILLTCHDGSIVSIETFKD